MNYARIEARYYEIDLMRTSVRRVLNLTYGWLFDLIGGTDQWEKDYAHVFDPDAHEDFDYVDLPYAPPPADYKGKTITTEDGEVLPVARLLPGI